MKTALKNLSLIFCADLVALFFSPFIIRCALVILARYFPIPILGYWECVMVCWAIQHFARLVHPQPIQLEKADDNEE